MIRCSLALLILTVRVVGHIVLRGFDATIIWMANLNNDMPESLGMKAATK